MTQPGETDGFSLEDHVRAIEKQQLSIGRRFDVVNYPIPNRASERNLI